MGKNKFKVWDTINKEWKDNKDIYMNGNGEYHEHFYGDMNNFYVFKLKDCEIVYYIGFNDKNNKELYVNDIVKWINGYNYQVKFGLYFNLDKQQNYGYYLYRYDHCIGLMPNNNNVNINNKTYIIENGNNPLIADTIEKIGNIYENIDLYNEINND